MQVFSGLQVLVLFVTIALVQSKIEDSKNIEDVASKAIDPASTGEESSDVLRKKKSATTTLCVEIRPSDPYQRPFQVCEPAAVKGYAPAPAPAPSYYPVQGYEEVKPSAATPKPAAAYEAPAKTYSAPAKPSPAPAYSSSKPYAAHSPSSYSSVSYRSDDGMAETEEDSDDSEEHMMRSAGDYGYGLPMTYLQPALKHKQKKGHNGLVITCQPSLAGYAATVPAAAAPSYGGAYGGYRAATNERSYNRYERPSPPKPYGYGPAPSYKAPAPAPVYKVPAPAYPSYRPSYPSPTYSPPQPAYNPPTYSAPSYSPPPAYKPAPDHAPAPAYKPVYAPAPAYKPVYAPAPAPAYKPVYAPSPAPVYAPPPPPPAPAPYSYPSGPSYGPPPPPPPPPTYSPAPKPHPQPAYSTPGTYRAADPMQKEGAEMPSQEEKEQHTLHTMTNVAEARAAPLANSKVENEEVKMPEPGWKQIHNEEKKSAPTEMSESWEKSAEQQMEANAV